MQRVLIAEDDPDTATAIKATLEERLGVIADHVTNGALVFDQIASLRPDVLILDVSLPGLNGVDVFDLIRGSDRWDGPILFLTATPERARRAFARKGIREIMQKPFELDVLTQRVSDLLARAQRAA